MIEEMRVTLDDVSCLLHLSIASRFLDHDGLEAKSGVVDQMHGLIDSCWSRGDWHWGGVHEWGTCTFQLPDYRIWELYGCNCCNWDGRWWREDEVDPWLGYPNLFIVIGGHYIFRDKSVKNYVDVTYMWYFCGMKLVNDFAWGAAALTHLYMELNVAFYFRMYKWSFSIKEFFFLLIRATKNKLFRRTIFGWNNRQTLLTSRPNSELS